MSYLEARYGGREALVCAIGVCVCVIYVVVWYFVLFVRELVTKCVVFLQVVDEYSQIELVRSTGNDGETEEEYNFNSEVAIVSQVSALPPLPLLSCTCSHIVVLSYLRTPFGRRSTDHENHASSTEFTL